MAMTQEEILMKSVGKTVAIIRTEREMTQKELSEKSGIGNSTLRKLEPGNAGGISLPTLAKITDTLDISLPLFFLRVMQAEDDDVVEIEYQYSEYNRTILQSMYPPNLFGHRISSLLQFMVYFPLLNFTELMDLLVRFRGVFLTREEYFLEKINKAIKHIPASKAKEYADMQFEFLEKHKNEKDLDYSTYLNDRSSYDAVAEEKYDAYMDSIYRLKELDNCISNLSRLLNEGCSSQPDD